MAIRNLKPIFDGIYKKLDPSDPGNRSKIARNLIERRFGHKSQINSIRFSKQMAISINNAVKAVGGTKDIATNDAVKAATERVFKHRMELKPFTDMSVKSEIKGDNLWVRRASKDSGKGNPEFFYNLNKVFKGAVFIAWKKKYKSDHGGANKVDKIKQETVSLDKAIGFSHDAHSNVANSLLLDFIYDNHVEGDAVNSISTVDVAKQIFSLLTIKWEQVQDPFEKDGVMRWQITGELAGHNPDFIKGTDLGQEWENHILNKFQDVIDGKAGEAFKDAAFEASDSFTHKIATKEMKRIADEYLKERGFTRGGQKIKVKNVPKKPKKSKRRGTAQKPKATIKSVVTKIMAIKATPVGRQKEKGQGKQASTDGARELARLRTYIQGRLPAEVRRNMGRDGALRNRKGRFSNSVKLLSLHQAPKSVVAKYTYMLRPYSTFENTGERRWRLSYNPKTLIAKSIRKLAQGRIEQKLTVRRV